MKSSNANNEVAIFIIILSLCYNEKIINEINYNIIIIAQLNQIFTNEIKKITKKKK